MFSITDKKGFSITFANGYTVSVQFGPANYCDHYDARYEEREECGEIGSGTAETALIKDNEFIKYEGDDVQGYRTPEQVLELLNYAAQLK